MTLDDAKKVILILLTRDEMEAGKLLGLFASYFSEYRDLIEQVFREQFFTALSDYWCFENDDPVDLMLNAGIRESVLNMLGFEREDDAWLPVKNKTKEEDSK